MLADIGREAGYTLDKPFWQIAITIKIDTHIFLYLIAANKVFHAVELIINYLLINIIAPTLVYCDGPLEDR